MTMIHKPLVEIHLQRILKKIIWKLTFLTKKDTYVEKFQFYIKNKIKDREIWTTELLS